MDLDVNLYKTEILIPRKDILKRVKELGIAISEDYKGKPLLLVGVLNGAVIFLSDLAREITIPVEIDCIRASSYGDGTESKGQVIINNNSGCPVNGKHVIIVEDIVDSGKTIAALMEHFKEEGAVSIAVCAFIDKKERREKDVKIDYVGFEVEEGFLVGYGLDYAKKFRQLPDICSLFKEDFTFINCRECNTAFKVKSSFIDEDGTIVRCSVCKHTFKTYKDGSQTECLITELEPAAFPGHAAGGRKTADTPDDIQETDSDKETAGEIKPIKFVHDIFLEQYSLNAEEPDEDEEPISIKQIIGEENNYTESIEEDTDDDKYQVSDSTEGPFFIHTAEYEETKKPGRRRTILPLLLICVLCVAIVLTFFILKDFIPPMFRLNKVDVTIQYDDSGTKNLSFEEIVGAFADGQSNSRLFIIRGFVRNNYLNVKHSILLTASILDDKGNVILKQYSYAGIKNKDEQSTTMPKLEPESERNEPIKEGDRETFVESGARIPFFIVFENLPDNVEEFTIEFVSASFVSDKPI